MICVEVKLRGSSGRLIASCKARYHSYQVYVDRVLTVCRLKLGRIFFIRGCLRSPSIMMDVTST